jgi:hypothetical protein
MSAHPPQLSLPHLAAPQLSVPDRAGPQSPGSHSAAPQSAICNLQSAIRNLQSAIRNPQSAIVLLPVYRPQPTPDELVALRRCVAVLGRHPLVLVAPAGLDLAPYTRHGAFGEERFDPAFFAGIASYNRLLLSAEFYARFQAHDYILVHQLDAFVFADRLDAWCAAGYDYVGAPWVGRSLWRVALHVSRSWPPSRPRLRGLRDAVGNGGFSLRRVSSHLACLERFAAKARSWRINEDYFWSLYAPGRGLPFRIPPTQAALGFAFETRPAACLARTRGALPFGCHGWDRHDRAFWRPIFRRLGHAI